MFPSLRLSARIAAMFGLCALTGIQVAAADPVQVCSFPESPTRVLDRQVVEAVFKTIGQPYRMVAYDFGESDDPVSGSKLARALATKCDTFVGLPVNRDIPTKDFRVSAPYARAQFVKFHLRQPTRDVRPAGLVAVAFESPAQIIAVRAHERKLDVVNTSADVVDAVVKGDAATGIVWYPTLVDYKGQNPAADFVIERVSSGLSNWELTFVAGPDKSALLDAISGAIGRLNRSGELRRLATPWEMSHADTPSSAAQAAAAAQVRRLGLATTVTSGFPRVSSDATEQHTAPFSDAQVASGGKLYTARCAKCHGEQLQGRTGPALRGPGFQPAQDSKASKAAIYLYLSTNMPADKPGKLKPQAYADIMAYLLHENGYAPSGKKLTDDAAGGDNSSFNSYVK